MKKSKNADKIIRSFAEMARIHGIRNVVMSELARTIGISTATLYRAFPTKADLVYATLSAWAAEFTQTISDASETVAGGPHDKLRMLVQKWVELKSRFNPTFWEQTRIDFPEAFEEFNTKLADGADFARTIIAPYMRPDVNPDVSEFILTSTLQALVNQQGPIPPKLDQAQAVDAVLDLWAQVALI